MKQILISIIMLLCLHDYALAADISYTDVSQLTLINKAQPDRESRLRRIDVERYPDLNKAVNRYYRFSTGLAIVFRTNSKAIYARWTTVNSSRRFETSLIAQRGLDLYIRRDGEWIFSGVGTPGHADAHQTALVEDMDDSVKECLLYLPLFDEVKSLEIGVEEGALLEPIPNPFRHKVVVVGSSITHGVGVSRPGMAYPARLERVMDMEFCNLGASGQCKLNRFYADIVADTEADVFIFDTFSNPSAKLIEERLESFVARIREAHPTTPLVFLQTEVRETGNFNLKKRSYEADKRTTAERNLKELMKKDRHIYFINPGMPLGDDHEATADGIHPTDLGFERILKTVQPKLEKILRKYGIK